MDLLLVALQSCSSSSIMTYLDGSSKYNRKYIIKGRSSSEAVVEERPEVEINRKSPSLSPVLGYDPAKMGTCPRGPVCADIGL